MWRRRAHRHAASARGLGHLFLHASSRARNPLARSVQGGASLFCPVLAHPSLTRANPSPPRVLVRSGHARFAVADDAAPPCVPGKPALAPSRAGLGPLAAPSPGFAVASRASALPTAQRARTRSARPHRRRSRARRSRFGVSVPFACSARRHARSERLLVMPRAGPLARLGATCPPARPRACAGKVKTKSYGALPRAHLLDLAAFLPSGRLVRLAGGSPRPRTCGARAPRACSA
jgi:hypothetical protein